MSSAAVFTDPSSPTGLGVGEALLLLDPAGVTSGMTAYAQLPTSCASFTAVISGLSFTFTAAPLAVTGHGSETTATRLTATATYSNEVITIYFDMVFMLDHDTIIAVVVSNGSAPDIGETENAAADAFTVYTQAAATW